MSKLLLIDGNSIMYRAYFSTAYSGRLMQTKAGFVTNALHGFINMMNKIQKDFDYTHVLVAFDAGRKTFRHDLLDSYKDGRAATPDEFKAQIPYIKQYLDLMGIHRHEVTNYEADDIIGSMAQIGCDEKFETIDVISGDKDLLQLVNDCVTVHFTVKGVTELHSFTPDAIREKYETTPDLIPDLKGLMGDSSDNLPGVPGIGEKTAIKLIKQFGSLEELLARTDELKGKQKENVENNKELALLCKEMATLDTKMTDLPSIATLVPADPDLEGLKDLFTEMEFNSFLKNLAVTTSTAEPVPPVEVEVVTDVAVLNGKDFTDCALHVEIFEANYHRGTVIGFAVMNKKDAYYVPFEIAKQSDPFASFLASPAIKKEMFDAKRAVVALKWAGLELAGVAGDLLLKAYVLNPTTADPEFAKVALHYGTDGIQYNEQVYGKGAKRAVPEITVMANHCLSIVAGIHGLTQELSHALKEADQWILYQEIELPLTFILAEMEFNGIAVDAEVLKAMGVDLNARIEKLAADIYELADTTFNIGSPKQLGVVLFEDIGLPGKKTKTGSYSTSADVLEKLKHEHPIIEKILAYRTLTKLDSTYIEGLQKVRFDNGKVHTIFNQALTQTGRLSSTEPNVQNIPIRLEEGRLIRKAFVPESSDNVLIGADYSQIELRILAHVCQTESLIEAFNNDEDIHAKTAAEVFGLDINAVTEDDRRAAKAINFGIVYGMSAFGLSENLNISPAEAKRYIENYLETYGGIKDYMAHTIKEAKVTGYVETLFLRRRYVPEITHKNFMVRSMAERTAINAPIQGSAADIIKVAMIEVDKLMKAQGVKSKMVLQVHDELLFDVPKDEVETMKKMIKTAMENATKLSVPLRADISSGQSWFETK
ncbi:MAG: DNA polymerase I [Turicibacter sp.]|nr:DNA polymerase I [Turicibacter sp.]